MQKSKIFAAVIISGDYTCYKLDDIDIKDNMILAAGLESKADYIISLDREHLLPLKNYQEMQIVNPHQFLKEFKDYEIITNNLTPKHKNTLCASASLREIIS
ncbi:hypothetical protein [Anabaena lutea]|uniref:PIN domain-containing protein n=1 Tax=Anabaena lutea FACHB-196 TaxID=2692881 RepID=A0ABR8FM75_9NOST|nr:hypothetical protein [Anabaena lutea]MBD2570668.1 hypothetical protein [Anabaena lutea FACHB-196]